MPATNSFWNWMAAWNQDDLLLLAQTHTHLLGKVFACRGVPSPIVQKCATLAKKFTQNVIG